MLQMMKPQALMGMAWIVLCVGCQPQGSPDSLNNVVPETTQIKVYQELRKATTKADKEMLASFSQDGSMLLDPAELRRTQDSLRVAYWQDVCDSNQVTMQYGDSIWTKGVKEKWPLGNRE